MDGGGWTRRTGRRADLVPAVTSFTSQQAGSCIARRFALASGGRARDALGVIVFTVKVHPGTDPQTLLSDEIKKETMAQVMTPQEAEAVGFSGFGEDPNLCLIAVADRDARWIEKALERSPAVYGYQPHKVD